MIDWLPTLLLLGAAILVLAASGLDYTLQRAWAFQRKRFRRGIETRRARLLARLGRPEHYSVDLREIRDFFISLQLGTSMNETLSGALLAAAQQMKHRGVFGERLSNHVEARLSIAPEEVIQALAEDFRSEHLRDLLLRLELAREGGISYERALSLSVSLIEEELRGDLERDIQQIPIKLTLPMIVGVFLPAIIIGIFPLALNVLGVLFTPGGP
jgi:hypothetical protein